MLLEPAGGIHHHGDFWEIIQELRVGFVAELGKLTQLQVSQAYQSSLVSCSKHACLHGFVHACQVPCAVVGYCCTCGLLVCVNSHMSSPQFICVELCIRLFAVQAMHTVVIGCYCWCGGTHSGCWVGLCLYRFDWLSMSQPRRLQQPELLKFGALKAGVVLSA